MTREKHTGTLLQYANDWASGMLRYYRHRWERQEREWSIVEEALRTDRALDGWQMMHGHDLVVMMSADHPGVIFAVRRLAFPPRPDHRFRASWHRMGGDTVTDRDPGLLRNGRNIWHAETEEGAAAAVLVFSALWKNEGECRAAELATNTEGC